MEAVPESPRMKKPANCPFGSSILASNACHQCTASALGINICHSRYREEAGWVRLASRAIRNGSSDSLFPVLSLSIGRLASE
jgi:hypothetical protein